MRIDQSAPVAVGTRTFAGEEPVGAAPLDSAAALPQDTVSLTASGIGSGLPGNANKVNPYIVMPPAGSTRKLTRDQLTQELAKKGKDFNVVFKNEIPLLGGVTATLDEKGRQALQQLGYRLVSDEPLRFILPQPTEKQRATTHYDDDPSTEGAERTDVRMPIAGPRFQSPLTEKYTGRGVTIAVLDTGIYPHPDFVSPNDRIIYFKDFVNGRAIPYDDNGHGTLVAGDAGGNGAMSNGLYRGPAPEANLIGVKVLNQNGGGRMSDILEGLNWCIENKQRYNIRVINLSLGNRASAHPEDDPIYQAVSRATEDGIVVVAAAGNEGPGPSTISTPGDNPDVITVGAADDFNTPTPDDDRIPDFSSRGPTLGGLAKPDVVAPGEGIVGPNAPVTPTEEQAKKYDDINQTLQWLRGLDDASLRQVPDATLRMVGLTDDTIDKIKTSPMAARMEIERLIEATDRLPLIDTSYVGAPGSSFAAPIVSGVVAEMLQANPSLEPAQVKDILTSTAHRLPHYGVNTQGAGMIDPDAALKAALAQTPNGYQTSVDDYLTAKQPA